MTEQQQMRELVIKLGQETGVSPVMQKIGIAVLMQESQLNPSACCFKLGFRKALYSCVYDGDKTIIHTPTGKWYSLDKEKKTLTCGNEVLKYWSWDRGICQWNSRAWPDITDEIVFNPEEALKLFWYWFVRKPSWWNGFKSKAYLAYL